MIAETELDSLDLMMQQLETEPLLTAAEERDLFARVAAGDAEARSPTRPTCRTCVARARPPYCPHPPRQKRRGRGRMCAQSAARRLSGCRRWPATAPKSTATARPSPPRPAPPSRPRPRRPLCARTADRRPMPAACCGRSCACAATRGARARRRTSPWPPPDPARFRLTRRRALGRDSERASKDHQCLHSIPQPRTLRNPQHARITPVSTGVRFSIPRGACSCS